MEWLALLNPALQFFTLIGACVVGYAHYRFEARLSKFRQEIADTLEDKFESKELAKAHSDLLVSKIDALRVEVMFRLEASADDHR